MLSADAAGAARVWPLDALAAAKAAAPRKLTDAERVQYNVPAAGRE